MSRTATRHLPGPMAWVARLPVAVQCIISAGLGVLAALGQAPYNQPLVLFVALLAVFLLYRGQNRPTKAALIGGAFGLGYFALAMVWILEPFQVDVERHGWMAPFALGLLSAGLALFWGAAFWAARRLSVRTWPLVGVWTAAEMLRAYVFTGFPWASPAQALVDSMAGQALALIGPHGLNLILFGAAWLLCTPAPQARWHAARVVQGVVLICAVAALTLGPRAPDAPLTGQIARLVQPNVPQELKWNPDYFETFFQRQLDLSAQPGAVPPDVVIWPEAAIPWLLDNAQGALSAMAQSAQGAPVVFGANRMQDGRLYNALAVIDPLGVVLHTYDKRKTVPFGEYIPLGNLLSRFGISGLATREGFGFSRGPGAQVLDLGPLGKALPLICYEAVFAHYPGGAPERPDVLIQITNDAWFGQDAGPQQHLAQARMRAIEQGLPLMRAANTGISAMIDPWGRVTHSLALGAQGALDAPVPQPRAATLYARTGDTPMVFVLIILMFAPRVRLGVKRISD